jgi:molybdopterin-biosynthesis enzyme MoeA-like protein
MRLDLAAGEQCDPWPPLPHAARLYILPGIPALLRAKVDALELLEGELPAVQDWALIQLHTRIDESRLAPALDAVVATFADVEIGSYPRFEPDEHGQLQVRVKLTFESGDPARAQAARDAMAASLDPADILDA